ncbi:MAG TPA: TIGR00730 family Rossman fold protein [Edaphobacter sp.]|nr:TIGR00730 family Rossman fold protein [Edaphobacter sp.]
MIRNAAIFCASSNGANPLYLESAIELGQALAQQNIGLIYGGANVGLMKAVAESSLAHGGRVVGVIPELLVDLEIAHQGITELHITTNMHTRKAMMSDLADAFLVLPGGFGTLEEMFEVLTWQSLRLHQKPVILININGFYDRLLGFLDHCVAEGVLKPHARENLRVVTGVREVFQLLLPSAS